MFAYLQEVKSEIRLTHSKALTGGKKVKKGAVEEKKVIENCTIFTSFEYPQYKKKVLEILSSFEWVDNVVQGDYITKIREEIKGKESGPALKFCAFIVEQAKTVG